MQINFQHQINEVDHQRQSTSVTNTPSGKRAVVPTPGNGTYGTTDIGHWAKAVDKSDVGIARHI